MTTLSLIFLQHESIRKEQESSIACEIPATLTFKHNNILGVWVELFSSVFGVILEALICKYYVKSREIVIKVISLFLLISQTL